ncbi:rhomboid family intramembrane serine protease [Paenibacillus sp.]|jgi:membrane associated rhomboid family serine protease|uniref:rhomboid family intramembrane serine protease n=1 Tax=Paenibacillus sp. TaxID=58172 RepID=UPI002818A25D|nr:rhomboid family intramembrane serine protease [Paenibacillus sp.]MDR0270626.1 rhomboid family intramembrane serine protease [Paenibacillus sp.]
MLFVRYENWKSYLKYYPITTILFVANIIMYLVIAFNGGASDTSTLLRFGALTNVEGYDEWWRYLSSIFLHGSFSHLLFNNFAILVFAPPLERLLGAWRYALLYLLTGVIGNILSVAHYNRIGEALLTIGASGAIYGVYGAFLYIALLQRNRMDEASRKTVYALLLVGIIFSFISGSEEFKVNWVAHLGGLIGGFFIYGLMARILKRVRRS